jgi:hypothetical protein
MLTAVSNALENYLAALSNMRLGTTSWYLMVCNENKIGPWRVRVSTSMKKLPNFTLACSLMF